MRHVWRAVRVRRWRSALYPAAVMRSIAEYQSLIARLEALAVRAPRQYLIRVAALAVLGMGVLVAAFCGALATVIGVAAFLIVSKKFALLKLAWIPLAFAFLILKAMCLRIPSPGGRVLAPHETPELFKVIEDVRRTLGAQKIHRVLVTPDFNAAIAQVPRMGWFGWPANHLAVGLPLMASLTVGEFRAVLAHELGHLSRHHARFGNWIYRIRQTWDRLLAILANEGSLATKPFAKFLAWYAPYFNAYSFVLARSNEYEADAASVRIAGAASTASALVAVHAKATYLENQYWRPLWATVGDSAEPPHAPYSGMLGRCKSMPADLGRAYIKLALKATSDVNDTHPSLADRLDALGVPPHARFELHRSAAEALLHDVFDRLVLEHDRMWRDAIAPLWRRRHETAASDRKRFNALEQEATAGDLPIETECERARLAEALEGRYRALALYRRILDRQPDHPPALYAYGRLLVQSGDKDGAVLVERAMSLDQEAEQPGAELLFEFCRGRKDLAGMDRWNTRLNVLAETRARARLELATFRAEDIFEPHTLSKQSCERLTSAIAAQKRVRRAWLVRKFSRESPRVSGYLLLLEFDWMAHFSGGSARTVRALLAEFAADQDGFIAIRDAAESRRLRKRVAALAGAEVFRRA
jgi:Zn-dependent protease with chaperone function